MKKKDSRSLSSNLKSGNILGSFIFVIGSMEGKEKQKKGFLHELKKNKLNYLTKLKLLFGLLYENFKLKKRENLKKNK